MTPCKERELYKGQWVWCKQGGHFYFSGEWIQLNWDDGSDLPIFSPKDHEEHYTRGVAVGLGRIDWSQGIHDEKPSWTPANARLCGAEEIEEYDPYSELERILADAYDQSAMGKGHERHSTGQRWEDQPICINTRLYGTGGPFLQVSKKMEESQRMSRDKAIEELKGGIVYLAAAIKVLEEQDE